MKKLFKIIAILVATLVLLVIVGLIRLNSDAQHVIIDGPAMEPTIHSNQRLTLTQYKVGELPKRGDIVEYTSSNMLVRKYSKSGKLLHRIIALPGERVTIDNNKVLVYNTQNPDGFNPDAAYLSGDVVTAGAIDLKLGQNRYFVMGDNRPNALDSRAFGPIAADDIIGKISF